MKYHYTIVLNKLVIGDDDSIQTKWFNDWIDEDKSIEAKALTRHIFSEMNNDKSVKEEIVILETDNKEEALKEFNKHPSDCVLSENQYGIKADVDLYGIFTCDPEIDIHREGYLHTPFAEKRYYLQGNIAN